MLYLWIQEGWKKVVTVSLELIGAAFCVFWEHAHVEAYEGAQAPEAR